MCVENIRLAKVVESNEGKRVNGRHWEVCFTSVVFFVHVVHSRVCADRMAIKCFFFLFLGVTQKFQFFICFKGQFFILA